MRASNPDRYAFRVWLPSWRLAPRESLPGLFRPGGAPGIHPSKRSPCHGYPDIPAGKGPRAVRCFGCLSSGTESRWKGLLRRLLGFDPETSPSSSTALKARRRPDASLGFRPSRVCSSATWNRISPVLLSRAWLVGSWCLLPRAPQSIDQPRTGPVREGRADPYRVPAPSDSRHSSAPRPRAMGSPCGRRGIAATTEPRFGT